MGGLNKMEVLQLYCFADPAVSEELFLKVTVALINYE